MDLQKAFVFLFLCGFGLKASTAEDCEKVLEGGSYTIKLDSPKRAGDTLIWKRTDNADHVIYQRRRVRITGDGTVDDSSNLLLKNVTSAMSGTYKAEHHHSDGTIIKSVTKKLCVILKVLVPKLDLKCSGREASLHCDAGSSKDFTLSWFHNNKELRDRSNPLKPTKPGEKDLYKCRLTNDKYEGDKEDSTATTALCAAPDDMLLFGFNKWIMIGIIGGGGFLLLVLIILLIVFSCKSHRRRKRRQRDEEELRLANLRYTGTGPRPRPKQSALGQPVPPTPDEQGYLNGPEGDPNLSLSPGPVEPQPRRNPRPRAPPPPTEEDDGIPPLPQPRRKGHHNQHA